MGLRSEYFGKNMRRAPTARIAFRTAFPLWEPRLSRMTTSPGFDCPTPDRRHCARHLDPVSRHHFGEPTSSLTEREAALLFQARRRLSAQGSGVIYISHRMDEIFRLCDRATVLPDGRYVATNGRRDQHAGPHRQALSHLGRKGSLVAPRRLAKVLNSLNPSLPGGQVMSSKKGWV
jgi:hypothetical protein